MCGIAGIVTRDGRDPPRDVLAALARALAHRGPDGQAIYVNQGVGLVHTRLAIIDVEHGDQPFISAHKVALIANGEIYNDLELRRELPGSFKTKSDCESALHAYLRDGEAFTKCLRGMYAIAIHDPAQARVFLARDPFGIKPLYYAETPLGLCFASEAQALVAAGLIVPKANVLARDELAAFQFTCVDETLFSGIHRVRPGETLLVENGCILKRFQSAAIPQTSIVSQSEAQAVEAFDAAWADSVRVHRRSDVPYGVFLSGGLDSTALMAMMAVQEQQPVVAYTAAFPGTTAHDERVLAAKVAETFGARHVEVEVSAEQFWSHLPAMVAVIDDPVADYAIVPSYLLAAKARADVKVILTGEGGDEIFAGYGRYRSATRPWPFAKKLWARNNLARSGVLRDPGEWRRSINIIERELDGSSLTRLQRAQALDIATWLPNDLLTKVDRCLMAHGIEGRVPFLDPIVADIAFRMPDDLKVHRGLGKWTLRKWLNKTLPSYPAFETKRGFSVPVAEWIAPQAARLARAVSEQPGVAELCEPSRVRRLFESADPGHGSVMWQLLFYALWHNRHILGRSAEGDVWSALNTD